MTAPFKGLELSVLRVEIIGNLGSDPEQRFTNSGVVQTTFSAAVNSRKRCADGEHVDRTDWFRVRTMGAKAEYVQRFTTGQRGLVIGRLEIGDWTTREGERRTSYDRALSNVAEKVRFALQDDAGVLSLGVEVAKLTSDPFLSLDHLDGSRLSRLGICQPHARLADKKMAEVNA